MKFYDRLIFCSVAFGTLFVRSAFAGTNGLEITPAFINELANEARTNHPALKSAEARVAAARANQESIRTWEDPMVRLGGMGADRGKRYDDGDFLYGVEQPLPLFGKPKAARRVAESEVKVEDANAEYQFQLLRKEIAQNVFKTALANRTAEIGREDLAWLDLMLAVAEQRYALGQAMQIDVLRLQNERSKRAEQLKTDWQMLEHERVNLNRLLNRDLKSAWPDLRLPHVAQPIVFNERLVTLALKFEPKLKMMQHQIEQAAATTEKTRRERYPNFNVGAEARNYTGNGDYRQGMVTLSFSLPWGNHNKYDAAIRRDEARKYAAELDAADYELAIRNEIHSLTVKIDTARREATLYRDEILPRSQTALESARAGWESNVGMFRDVMEGRRMVIDAQLMSVRAISEQYQMLSELVLCCGLGDLEALQMIGSKIGSENPEPNK